MIGRTSRSRRKGAYHHGALRQALLDAALALLDEGGVAGLTLRAAARRAGVSHMAPYHHFASKEALIAAVAVAGFDALTAEMERARDRAKSPLEGFRATGRAYVRFAQEHAAQFRVMFRLDLSKPEMASARAAGVACFGVLERQVGAAYPKAPPHELQRRALAAWALAHGVATLWNDGPLAVVVGPRADLKELAVELMRPAG